MQTNNQHKSEDEIDILEILFVLLSYRWLIFSSIIIFAIIGSLYNYYHQDIFKTNATLLIVTISQTHHLLLTIMTMNFYTTTVLKVKTRFQFLNQH